MILTDEALRSYDPRFKVNPPLRSEEHRKAVVEGLVDGTIDAIVTDHAPHTIEEKTVNFPWLRAALSGWKLHSVQYLPTCIIRGLST